MKDAPGKVTFLHRKHSERGKSYFSPLICMHRFTAWIPEFRTVRWERTREPLTPGDTLLHKMGTSTAVGPPGALWGLLPMCLQLCRWIWLEKDTAMLARLTLNQWPYALLVWPQVITAPGGALGAAPLTILSLQVHFSLLIALKTISELFLLLETFNTISPPHFASYFTEKRKEIRRDWEDWCYMFLPVGICASQYSESQSSNVASLLNLRKGSVPHWLTHGGVLPLPLLGLSYHSSKWHLLTPKFYDLLWEFYQEMKMILKTQIPQSTREHLLQWLFPRRPHKSPHQLKSTLFRLDAHFQNPCLLSPRGRTSLPENWLGTFTCGNPCHPQPTTLSSADLYALKFAFLTLTGSVEAWLHADFPSLFTSCRYCFNLITFVYLSLTYSDLGPGDNFSQIIIFNKRIGQ